MRGVLRLYDWMWLARRPSNSSSALNCWECEQISIILSHRWTTHVCLKTPEETLHRWDSQWTKPQDDTFSAVESRHRCRNTVFEHGFELLAGRQVVFLMGSGIAATKSIVQRIRTFLRSE